MDDAFRALLACPACRGSLDAGWRCQSCGIAYAVPDGVPALRLHGDRRTEVVRDFYTAAPFPNYPPRDSLTWLRTRAGRSRFARLLDEAVPGDARIVEIGCGTGQMSLYLARADRIVIGADLTRASLLLGAAAATRFGIDNVMMVETDLAQPGLRPGAYFRSVVGDPLGLRAWIGLPADELGSLARLTEAEGRPPMPGPEHLLTRIVTMNGALVFPGLDVPHGWNDPALLGMELPGAGAVASATGLAGLYAAAVTGIDGSARLLTADTVTDAVREVSSGQGFLGFDAGARWGSGYLLDSATFRPLLGARSFGNDGAGGQFAFGDDEYGVGFGYVANRMIGHGDDRDFRIERRTDIAVFAVGGEDLHPRSVRHHDPRLFLVADGVEHGDIVLATHGHPDFLAVGRKEGFMRRAADIGRVLDHVGRGIDEGDGIRSDRDHGQRAVIG